MKRWSIVLGFSGCLLLQACTSVHFAEQATISRDAILNGTALFGAEAISWELPEEDILALDEEMHTFLDESISSSKSGRNKAKKLLVAMLNEGLLGLDYNPRKTFTASETFHQRTGNCLAFTNLFMALAREAGLKVSYQQVDVPPIWMSGGDVVVLNRHINVLIDLPRSVDQIVDFNQDEYQADYKTRLVSDDSAFAQYYSNIGVNYLEKNEYDNAFRYLKQALAMDAENADIWVNMGALYSRNKMYKYAESAYFYALGEDARNLTAHSNLNGLYEYWGDKERAAFHHTRIKHYRDKNPYYHFWLAQEAFRENHFDQSLEHIKKAIDRKWDESVFYFVKGIIHLEMAEESKAKESFDLAMKYAEPESLKRKYLRKLALLQKQ